MNKGNAGNSSTRKYSLAKGREEMLRARDIVGLPVLNLKTGDCVGRVQDIVFDNENKVLGIVLEGNNWLRPTVNIPSELICAVGKDALTVKDYAIQEIKGMLWSQKVGNEVYTQNGEAQGTIADVFLDDSMHEIVGYEVSDGLFMDIVRGRGAIFQENVMMDGKDVLIVDDGASPWNQNEGGAFS